MSLKSILKNSILLSIIILFLILFQKVDTKYSFGFCPNIKYDSEIIDLKPYLGKWYEIIRSKTSPFQKGNCVTAEYSINEKGNIGIINKEIRDNILFREIGEGNLTLDNNRIIVTFGSSIWIYIFPGDYRIVKTDFKNYSIVYSCSQYFFMKFELVWVIVRDPHNIKQTKIDEFTQYLNEKLNFKQKELFYPKHDPITCRISHIEKKYEM